MGFYRHREKYFNCFYALGDGLGHMGLLIQDLSGQQNDMKIGLVP